MNIVRLRQINKYNILGFCSVFEIIINITATGHSIFMHSRSNLHIRMTAMIYVIKL